MISPGLARISSLILDSTFTWKAIHIAGTNGKGSVCAYTSAMLRSAGIRAGRFTSPHLHHPSDSIVIDEQAVPEAVFRAMEDKVKQIDATYGIGASEFELLTATAFEVFANQDVAVGVVETGMGGSLDATNVLQNPLVTIITKIGIDHQAYLGSTLEDITGHKAGIMKAGVPCIIDGTNHPSVLARLEQYADEIGAGELSYIPNPGEEAIIWDQLERTDYAPHQQTNLGCAFAAVRKALAQLGIHSIKYQTLLQAASQVLWPGRLQHISITQLTGRTAKILIDGAHNTNAASELAQYVNHSLRSPHSNPPGAVTWILAFSQGKDMQSILSVLLQPGDKVVAVQFGPVDSMPWVVSSKSRKVVDAVKALGPWGGVVRDCGGDVEEAVRQGSEIAEEGPMVVCGSLYLVADVLRLLQRSQGELQLH